jgi:drug/metabolite transporter (DMT)-like permease
LRASGRIDGPGADGRPAQALTPTALRGSGHRSQPSSLAVWTVIIAVSGLWGTAGVATRAALQGGVGPYALTTLRMTVASILVLAYLAATGKRVRVSRHLLGDGAVMALAQVVLPSVLFAAALQHLPSGAVSLLYALVPAATVVWMRLLLGTGSLGRPALFGLTIAGAGAALVVLAPAPGTARAAGSILGAGLVVVAVTVASFAGVYAKRHAGHPPLDMIAPEIVMGTTLLLAPGLLGLGMNWEGLSLGTWAVVGYLAIGVTIMPIAMLFWLVKRTSALRASLVSYLFPVVAVALGILWFGERLTSELAVGGSVLLVGVGLVDAALDRRIGRTEIRLCPDVGPMTVVDGGSAPWGSEAPGRRAGTAGSSIVEDSLR